MVKESTPAKKSNINFLNIFKRATDDDPSLVFTDLSFRQCQIQLDKSLIDVKELSSSLLSSNKKFNVLKKDFDVLNFKFENQLTKYESKNTSFESQRQISEFKLQEKQDELHLLKQESSKYEKDLNQKLTEMQLEVTILFNITVLPRVGARATR